MGMGGELPTRISGKGSEGPAPLMREANRFPKGSKTILFTDSVSPSPLLLVVTKLPQGIYWYLESEKNLASGTA